MENRVRNISDFQFLQNAWERSVLSEEDLQPIPRFERMLQEVDEAREEAERLNGSEVSRERLGREVADIIFIALGVLSTLHLSAEDELNRILEMNYYKYNPVVNGELRNNGMTHREAMQHQKQVWNGK